MRWAKLHDTSRRLAVTFGKNGAHTMWRKLVRYLSALLDINLFARWPAFSGEADTPSQAQNLCRIPARIGQAVD